MEKSVLDATPPSGVRLSSAIQMENEVVLCVKVALLVSNTHMRDGRACTLPRMVTGPESAIDVDADPSSLAPSVASQ